MWFALLILALPTILGWGESEPIVVSQPPLPPIRLSPRPVALASWYHLPGRVTASGEPYEGNVAAHKTLPFGSQWTLCREDHPAICATVIVKDRGPWIKGRDWDIGRKAATKLGMLHDGLCRVTARKR
jgi:rare lipoprotein A